VKNVKNGLSARTKILDTLEKRTINAIAIAKETSMSYNAVMHHLRLLENEGTINRKGKRPYFWLLTGLGQKRLIS
jgi:predicted transcriptional regulator